MTEATRRGVDWFTVGAQVYRVWHAYGANGVEHAEIVEIEKITKAGVAYVGPSRFKLAKDGKHAYRFDQRGLRGILYPRNGGNARRFKLALKTQAQAASDREHRRIEAERKQAVRDAARDRRAAAFDGMLGEPGVPTLYREALEWARKVNAGGDQDDE